MHDDGRALDQVGVRSSTQQAGLEGGQNVQDKAPAEVQVSLLLHSVGPGHAADLLTDGACLEGRAELGHWGIRRYSQCLHAGQQLLALSGGLLGLLQIAVIQGLGCCQLLRIQRNLAGCNLAPNPFKFSQR